MAKPPRDHRIDALGDRQKSAYEFPHALSRVLANPALACNATTLSPARSSTLHTCMTKADTDHLGGLLQHRRDHARWHAPSLARGPAKQSVDPDPHVDKRIVAWPRQSACSRCRGATCIIAGSRARARASHMDERTITLNA